MTWRSWEVEPLSRAQIERIASDQRALWRTLKQQDPDCFPIDRFIEFVLVPYLPGFQLELVDDEEMPGYEGATWPDQRLMRFPNSVYEGACAGDPRSRFTMAHELGHLMLHEGTQRFDRRTDPAQRVVAYRDSEWQANEYAASILMPRHIVKQLRCATQIADRCGVSYHAASTRLKTLKF